MGKKIYKYTLNYHGVPEIVKLPVGAEIISWHEQNEAFYLWAIVNSSEKKVKERILMIIATGQEIPGKVITSYGIQTLQNNSLVFHLLELKEIKKGSGPTLANDPELDDRIEEKK